VFARYNEPVGRLEEIRALGRGTGLVVTEYVLGEAGLLERMHVGVRLLFGLERHGYVVRWDQLDISRPERPRLLCPLEELQELEG
jgi:hypothetical protein